MHTRLVDGSYQCYLCPQNNRDRFNCEVHLLSHFFAKEKLAEKHFHELIDPFVIDHDNNATFVCLICKRVLKATRGSRRIRDHFCTKHLGPSVEEKEALERLCHDVSNYLGPLSDALGDEIQVRSMILEVPGVGYHCRECGYSSSITIVKNHVRARHLKSRPFGCQMCSKRFPGEPHRQIHYKKVHNLSLTSKQIREMDTTSGNILNDSSLDVYLGASDSGQKIMCRVCGYKANRGNVLKHVRWKHLKIKPFSCTMCATLMSTREDLQEHYKRRHKLNLTLKELTRLLPNPSTVPGAIFFP
ncbi:hypothetical protein TCAL_16337 [Tigriopus californicus]|uniref:C2H2-type domain-containing protein n=1 Tax=Tigriopus californicus TaxID=6832 RepID=A0A553N738_TIGCA|nr:hypothetical protein TCAL_16337 [Tigriopus californicus]